MADTRKKEVLDHFGEVIAALEKERDSRIYCVIHTSAPAHLCSPDVGALVHHRENFEKIKRLEVLLHSPGGHADAAYKIMGHFRRKAAKLNVLVPLMAKSAATLMCLAADTIFMGEFAELGPIDVQITDPVEVGEAPLSPLNEFKSLEFLADHAMEVLDLFSSVLRDRYGMGVKDSIDQVIPCVTEMMKPLYEAVNPMIMGEHRRDLAVGEQYAKRLLARANNVHTEDIVHRLVWDYPSHGFNIDIEEAKSLHLPVESLDSAQDKTLVDLIMELGRNDISHTGFAPTVAERESRLIRRKRPVPAREGDGQKKAAAAIA